MKIGLCGAGGTGKGTIVRALVNYMNIVPIYSSVEYIGKLIKPESKSFSEFSNEERALFQYSAVSAQIQNENFLVSQNKDFVSERSVFDYLVYWGVNNSIGGYEMFRDYVLRAYRKNPYNFLFFIPIEFEANDIEVSSWKERDKESRMSRERILKDILFEKNLAERSKITVLHGTVDERVKTILSAVL